MWRMVIEELARVKNGPRQFNLFGESGWEGLSHECTI